MGSSFDEVSEGVARRLGERFSRRSLLSRVATVAVLVGAGEAGVMAFGAAPALAFSPLCSNGCFGNCPNGWNEGGCWIGCDAATCAQGCCGLLGMKICDCCAGCAVSCSNCGRNPCIYGGGQCVFCRRVVECYRGSSPMLADSALAPTCC